ncbi:hypothetical protein Hypma_014852 [Hypsizygus marmoreus]|uniref:Uncharacterized protein n=1 Tax=Hypsizygus marmoreus TaxID=39966 RepID=A0A369K6Z3_HYPMA|nr:hypothetical protein Hypma_014852 [Hypsizygus marmoreus]
MTSSPVISTMKFGAVASTLLITLSFGLYAAASPLDTSLAAPLPSYLGSSNTFYRAVTGGELSQVNAIYHVGAHPTKHTTEAGDFSYSGGLYVFKDINEAKQWGTCWAKVQLDPAKKKWYLITMTYTPNSRLTTKTFKDQTAEWKTFVNGNYVKQGPHYDIIEGPISVGNGDRLQAYINGDQKMVWQGAFVGQNALATLLVTAVTLYDDSWSVRECCRNCNIQLVDQSAANQWALFQ